MDRRLQWHYFSSGSLESGLMCFPDFVGCYCVFVSSSRVPSRSKAYLENACGLRTNWIYTTKMSPMLRPGSKRIHLWGPGTVLFLAQYQ